jgi:hypothetical protein
MTIHITGTYRYAVLIGNATKPEYKCKQCKGFHNRRTCPVGKDSEDQVDQEGYHQNEDTHDNNQEADEQLDFVQMDHDQTYEIQYNNDLHYWESDDEHQEENVDEDVANESLEEPSNIVGNASVEPYGNIIDLIVPSDYFKIFREASEESTNKGRDGLETLGYLFGKDIGSSRCVTHLVIMDQDATHSSCETTNRGNEQVALFAEQNPSLHIVGWSHTHPRQVSKIIIS